MNKYIMIIATIFWAGAFIAGKFSVAEFPIISLVFFRFFFATIVIFPFMIRKEESWKIDKEDIPLMIKLGLIGMVGYHVFFFMALKFTSATNSSLIGATNPIITTIIAAIFLKSKIEKKHIISMICSFTGVMLIVTGGDLSNILNLDVNKGDFIMILAVICWASYSLMSKDALKKYSPIKVTSYAFLVCIITLLPFVFLEKPWEFIPKVSALGWASVLYMSVFASVCGYLIQQISIKNIGPLKTNLYINLVPVFSMILAAVMLGEQITIVKIIAAVFIVSSILISNISKKTEEEINIAENK